MDYVQLLAIPLCLAVSISAVTLICLYCVRFKVEPSSGNEKYVHRKKHHNKQIPEVSVVACSSAPVHPYLPPSLCTVTNTSCGTDQLSVTLAGMDSSASGTVALLVRQEGNSHRNCELPPVPSGADYKQDPTELRRYSICDDPQSESDGLYASVGHHSTANGGVGVSRSRHRPHATTTVDSNEANLPTDHRDSVVDSVTAPYYSSVASVLLPNEYGDLSDCTLLRPYLPYSAQMLQSNNLYARVRPRHERLGLNIDANLQTTGTVPFDNLVEASGSRPSGLDSSVTVANTSTHSPPRSTAESAYTSHGLNTSQTCFATRPFQSLFAAGDLTLTNENHYGKISVRESLASLRARRAFPQLGPNTPDPCRANCGQLSPNVTFGVQSEYERVSGSASETNNSTYDFVPQASSSMGPVTEIVQSLEPQSEPERKPRLPSEAYMDVSDSTGNERITSDKSFPLVGSRPGVFANSRTHILTEMQSFRHMDSEIDLTHSRQLDSDNGDMFITVRPRLIQSSEAFDLYTHSNPGASRNSAERSVSSHVDLHANRPRGPDISSLSGAVIPELLSVASRIPSIDSAGGGSRILSSDSAPVQLSTLRVCIRPLIANSADSFGPMTPVMERSTEDYSLSSPHQYAASSTQHQASVLDISGFSPQHPPVTGSSASSPTDTNVGVRALLSSFHSTRNQQCNPNGSPTVFRGSEVLDGSTYDDVALS